jgi:hypothetical protein
VANALIIGAVAGSIIAAIMLTHMMSDETTLALVHAPPQNVCVKNGLSAGRLDDCIQVTDQAAAEATDSAE